MIYVYGTIRYSTWTCNPYRFLRSVRNQVFLHSFHPSCSKGSCSSYSSQVLFLPILFMLESGLQSENVTYCQHAVHNCVKLQSKQAYNNIIIYEKSTIHSRYFGACSGPPQSRAGLCTYTTSILFPCASRICLTVCYGQDEMACHRHYSHCFLSTWGAFRLATPQVER